MHIGNRTNPIQSISFHSDPIYLLSTHVLFYNQFSQSHSPSSFFFLGKNNNNNNNNVANYCTSYVHTLYLSIQIQSNPILLIPVTRWEPYSEQEADFDCYSFTISYLHPRFFSLSIYLSIKQHHHIKNSYRYIIYSYRKSTSPQPKKTHSSNYNYNYNHNYK